MRFRRRRSMRRGRRSYGRRPMRRRGRRSYSRRGSAGRRRGVRRLRIGYRF